MAERTMHFLRSTVIHDVSYFVSLLVCDYFHAEFRATNCKCLIAVDVQTKTKQIRSTAMFFYVAQKDCLRRILQAITQLTGHDVLMFLLRRSLCWY
jgi:hypothetical protein